MDQKQLEAELSEVFEKYGMRNFGLHVDRYYTDDNYYTLHRDVWESSEFCFENVDVDFTLWFKHEYPVTKLVLTEDLINAAKIYLAEEDYEPYEDKPYMELPDEIQQWVDAWYDEIDFYDVSDDVVVQEIFGCEYPNEEFNDMETLAYWLIYFEPRVMDEELAHECGLLPFTWKQEYELLALGGCGMDLSPKLDAYQAMVDGTIPSDSQAFRQPSYFDYVSPFKTDEVLKKCEREEPVYSMKAVPRAVA